MNSGDGGRGGGFFFFSEDNQLILKSMTDEELQGFKSK